SLHLTATLKPPKKMSAERPVWVPIESNPDVINKFLSALGVADDSCRVVDVLGVDEELLPFIEGPVLSLVLLYPDYEDVTKRAADLGDNTVEVDKDLYFMRQLVGNACGTIALLHAIANNCHRIRFTDDSCLKKFLDSTRGMSAEESGRLFAKNAEICEIHGLFASEGQTQPRPDGGSEGHFVPLVHCNGGLYLCDATRDRAVSFGKTSEETFLSDAARVCRQVMAKHENNMNAEEPDWIPIESNPDVINKFLSALGVADDSCRVVDVLGVDEELLPFIEGPVLSLVLLYPDYEDETRRVGDLGDNTVEVDKDLYFMRQRVGGACGTIALLHAIANNCHRIRFTEDSCLKKFLDSTRGMSAEESGRLFVSNEDIRDIHHVFAVEGQTEAPPDDSSDGHFVPLVHCNGWLYLCDATRDQAVGFGRTSEDTFLSDAARVCRQAMARQPNNNKFSVMALVGQWV
ncbi:unnamed protein product, partial [Medioppia subpectinata]